MNTPVKHLSVATVDPGFECEKSFVLWEWHAEDRRMELCGVAVDEKGFHNQSVTNFVHFEHSLGVLLLFH